MPLEIADTARAINLIQNLFLATIIPKIGGILSCCNMQNTLGNHVVSTSHSG